MPFGINTPSYQSSALEPSGTSNGNVSDQSSVSLTIGRMLGREGGPEKVGGRAPPTTSLARRAPGLEPRGMRAMARSHRWGVIDEVSPPAMLQVGDTFSLSQNWAELVFGTNSMDQQATPARVLKGRVYSDL